jgi:CHC2 zinc finger/RepB DNA-primase from phage plasmid
MDSSNRADGSLQAYLDVLFERAAREEFIEIRHRVARDAFASAFFESHARAAVAQAIRERSPTTDVYVGVVARTRRAGTKDAIAPVHVLWAECDSRAAAAAALGWSPRPPLVVASGSGDNLHAYWPLSRPLTPQEAEVANLRLARTLGADAACFDAGRILRPPGTWNHKHRPAHAVAMRRLEARKRFEPEQVVDRCVEIDVAPLEQRWREAPARNATGDPLLALPPDVYVAELLGVRPGRNRKISCPFHDDARPSLHVYTVAERGWSCFSCRRGGSVYDLAAELWGLETRGREFVELRRRLMDRFRPELDRSLERSLS